MDPDHILERYVAVVKKEQELIAVPSWARDLECRYPSHECDNGCAPDRLAFLLEQTEPRCRPHDHGAMLDRLKKQVQERLQAASARMQLAKLDQQQQELDRQRALLRAQLEESKEAAEQLDQKMEKLEEEKEAARRAREGSPKNRTRSREEPVLLRFFCLRQHSSPAPRQHSSHRTRRWHADRRRSRAALAAPVYESARDFQCEKSIFPRREITLTCVTW